VLLTSMSLYFFGLLMPKRAHFAAEKYHKLLGFKEFIQRAEKEKLRDLLQENPKYFDETVAFAIVMGLGSEWADKFHDLIQSEPDWYQSSNGHTFSTSLLVSSIISSMYHMDHNFNYKYTSYSSGYHSGSRSSGFSSFGGGVVFSGFSVGGGFSGGGFGGGGGSSW